MLINKQGANAPEPVMPYAKGQCAYTLNFRDQKISGLHGVKELLGYSDEEFSFNAITDFIHPVDITNFNRLMYAIVDYTTQTFILPELVLNVTFRIRKKDGDYIKVLRQTSIYYNDADSQMISHYNILTDISFMQCSNRVEWKFDAPHFDQHKFKMYVNQSYQKIFSLRELEILSLINKGFTSHAIAAKLFLSKHTIDTHRRKMLQKTGCINAIELLEFYRLNVL